MSASKIVSQMPSVSIAPEADALITREELREAATSLFHLVGELLPGTAQIDVLTSLEPEAGGVERLLLEVQSAMDRRAFHSAVTEIYNRLYQQGSPLPARLSIVKA